MTATIASWESTGGTKKRRSKLPNRSLQRKPTEFFVGNEAGAPPDPMANILFGALYESMGDFKSSHYAFEQPLLEILYDWAIYLTKCDEVALYLLWPILKDVEALDPNTPVPGFKLWQYNCRTDYWIKEGDLKSGVVCVQPPWAR